jgi:hypothetical protein
MLQRKSVQPLILSAVVILVVSLLAAGISLTIQKPIDKREANATPLPGVQVTIVNKSAPGSVPKSLTTDKEGNFDFGVLPAGVYVMSLTLTDDAAGRSRNNDVFIKQSGVARSSGPALIKLTVEGAVEGTIVRGWDPKTKKAVDLAGATSQAKGDARRKTLDKMSPQMRQAEPGSVITPDIEFTTDGKQRLKGSTHDVSMQSIRNLK